MSELTVISAVRPRSVSRARTLLFAAAALALSIAVGWLLNGTLNRTAEGPAGALSERPLHRAAARPPSPPSARPAADAPLPSTSMRVASDAAAAALFAPHTWHLEPPPLPPAPPAPPPPPTAPPFPYAFVGTYTQGGETVYFLSREDRVIDAHVGDHLDGSYVFESADPAQLVFNYVPLNMRQSVPLAVKP